MNYKNMTTEQLRQHALQTITDENHLKIISFDKISRFTIETLLAKHHGTEMPEYERKYNPRFKDHKTR